MSSLDITTVLVTLITVAGPLAGVYVGYLLTNRNEKKKRHQALLEELCALSLQVNREINTIVMNKDKDVSWVKVTEPLDRMAVIITMFYNKLVVFKQYSKCIFDLQITCNQLHHLLTTTNVSPDIKSQETKRLLEGLDVYQKRLGDLLDEIAKLNK